VSEVNQRNTDGRVQGGPRDVPTGGSPTDQAEPSAFVLPIYSAESEETDVAIDHIVDDWTELRDEKSRKEAQAQTERQRFLDDFRKLDESMIQPAMEATLKELRKDGGGGRIDVREEDLMHRPRVTLWMSLEGEIKGSPHQDKYPLLTTRRRRCSPPDNRVGRGYVDERRSEPRYSASQDG
jgi:hypothetical protein